MMIGSILIGTGKESMSPILPPSLGKKTVVRCCINADHAGKNKI